MKWLHNLLKGLSLTTALFIFQACYGTPEGFYDSRLLFKVVTADTNEPLDGVKISYRIQKSDVPDWVDGAVTNETGHGAIWFPTLEEFPYQFRFEKEGAPYLVKDTVLTDMTRRTIEINLVKAE